MGIIKLASGSFAVRVTLKGKMILNKSFKTLQEAESSYTAQRNVYFAPIKGNQHWCDKCKKYFDFEEMSKSKKLKSGCTNKCKKCRNKITYPATGRVRMREVAKRKARQREFVEKFNKRDWS